MKPLKKLFLMLSLAFTMNAPLFAQEQIAEFLKFDINDANKLATAYIEPFGKMFGNSLNGGWYQAARPHKLFGFNLTFTTVVSLPFPDTKTFDFNELGLSNSLSLADPSKNLSPTITGTGNGIIVNYTTNIEGVDVVVPITFPKGVGLPLTPMPFIQGSIGLPFHSELTARYFPTVEIPNVGRISMWGIGAKNEFKEFIPVIKALPIDLSVMVGYTKFTSEFDVNYKPTPDNIYAGHPALSEFNEQKLGLNASGFTARLLVGKSIPLLSVYAGLGYSYATTGFGLNGMYPIAINPQGQPTNIGAIEDPINLDFKYNDFSANAGFRIRFGVIAVHADYTLSKYPLFAAGLGISFR